MFTRARRAEVERAIVKSVIEAAIKQGWRLDAASNGEEYEEDIGPKRAMEIAFACDEAHVYFRKGEQRGWVFIVLGNEGWTVIADYTISLDPVIDSIQELVDRFEKEDTES